MGFRYGCRRKGKGAIMKRFLTVWAGCLLFLTATLQAGETVLVRLVRASNVPGIDPAVQDVKQAMSDNFAFKGFSLQDQKTFTLPADTTFTLGEYSIKCQGSQRQLKIFVGQNKKLLVNTDVTLIDGKPLVVGGFPAQDGHNLIVFTSR